MIYKILYNMNDSTMYQCKFRFCYGVLRNTPCNIILSSNHAFCRFHGSIEDRTRRNLQTNRWFLSFQPSNVESLMIFKDYYNKFIDKYGVPESTDDDYIETIHDYSQEKEIPLIGCRYMITIGKYMGYYCGRSNNICREMCPFHESVIGWERDHFPSRHLVPFWAKCIRPEELDRKLSITEFPWKNYDIANLLFFNIESQDVQCWQEMHELRIDNKLQLSNW